GAHLEAMQRHGLTVRTPEGEFTIPVTAVADTRGVGPVDLVLFCVKSYDTEPAAQALVPLMARGTGCSRSRMVSTTSTRSPRSSAPDRKSTRLNSSHVAISYA